MADPFPTLLAEQARLQPMLDRLLTLAALWADPPAPPPGQAHAEPTSSTTDTINHGPAQALVFADAWGAQSPGPATAAAQAATLAQPEIPGRPQVTPTPIAITPPTTPAPPLAAAATGAVASARLSRPRQQQPAAGTKGAAASPFAALASVASAQRASPPLALNNPEQAQPPPSNHAAPATMRPMAAASSPSRSLMTAPAGIAATDSLARLGMVLAATSTATVGAPTTPSGAARMGANGRAPSQPAKDAASFPAPLWPAASLRGPTADPSMGQIGGDTLEDRLADILERAAAEAGVLLP